MPPGISLCMIVKNEERFLAQCLESVKDFVDEINIVDTGSTDGTIAIAKQFGAKVQEHAWRNDFSWARNKSVDMASRRWILQLDADEELLPESGPALAQIAQAPAHLTGVWLRCVNSSDRYRGGGTVSHAIIRMFPNHPRVRFHGSIHEFPSVDDSPLSMNAVLAPVKILHHGYLADVVNDRDKYSRNMSIIEQSVIEHPEDAFHWYNLGMTAHLNAEHARAAPALEKMWELCLKHGMRAFAANGLQILADVYSEHLNDPERGLHWALECLKKAPRYANAHFSAGKAYFLLKRYDEAREMYSLAIDDAQYMDRQFVVDDEVPVWKAQCEIGSTFAEQGDHARALEWFAKGIANRPSIQPLRVNYGKALENTGNIEKAEAVFQALYDEFGDEHSTVDLVNFRLRHGKEREAVDLIDAGHSSLSPVAQSSMLLAAAHVVRKNAWGDGDRYVRAAHEIDPQSDAVCAAMAALSAPPVANAYELALEAARARRVDDALGHLALILDDANAEHAYLLKGTLLRETGRPHEALQALERALSKNPANLDALLMKAALLEASHDAAQAEEVLVQALPLARGRVSIELAGLYLRSGRVADAKRVAEEALA